jgi:uncharacterized protein YqeY
MNEINEPDFDDINYVLDLSEVMRRLEQDRIIQSINREIDSSTDMATPFVDGLRRSIAIIEAEQMDSIDDYFEQKLF